MTQQYMIGELSVLLAQLQTTSIDRTAAGAVAQLRREVESKPPYALAGVAYRALELSDALCWDSLSHLDTATSARQFTIAVEIREFGECSGLIDEGPGTPIHLSSGSR